MSETKTPKKRLKVGKLACIAAVAVIVISIIYSLTAFLTHGDSDASNPYRTDWLRGLTANGGLYTDTLPQGSKEAITAAAQDGNYNLLLEVKAADGLALDYADSYPLSDALALTTDGKCNVIIQINSGGAKAAEELCTLLTDIGYKGNLAVQSADIRVLSWLKNNRPALVRGLVTEGPDVNGFEGFCQKNMLLNFKCRPHYAVFDAKLMPTLASDLISREMPILASNVSDIKLITALGENADGFILEGYEFEN